MILAAHLILSAYGFWLPNDPRGSWSDYVRNINLLQFGNATKIDARQSVATRPHNAALRAAAKQKLAYPPVRFTGIQARAIGRGFADAVRRTHCTIYACAILPDHTHLVVAKPRYDVEQLVNLLKGAATAQLQRENLHPFSRLAAGPQGRVASPWSHAHWQVWLNTPTAIHRAIAYTNANPPHSGLPQQHWTFLTSSLN